MNHNDRGGAALTRLGRVVRTAGGPARPAEPQHREEHRQANWLRDVILGGQDGLVNILGIILGVIAGGGSNAVLLAAGFAAAFTESISMGAVGWTSACPSATTTRPSKTGRLPRSTPPRRQAA